MSDDISTSPVPRETGPSAAVVTEQEIALLGQRIARMERERRRVRPEDWQTLFRQTRTILEQLATHPFLRGDAEAETRLKQIMRSADFDELDQRVDRLAEYVSGKMAFNAAMRGEPVDPSSLHPTSTAQTRATGRAARDSARYGPSGDDFEVAEEQAATASAQETEAAQTGQERPQAEPPAPRRRSVLRL